MPSLNFAARTFEHELHPTLRIGVTGHRFLAESGKLLDGMCLVCKQIERRFPGSSWLVVSPLAEGTDQLVSHYLLDRGARLQVPLPLPLEAYLKDFAEPASRQEFLDLMARAAGVVQLPPAAYAGRCLPASGPLYSAEL